MTLKKFTIYRQLDAMDCGPACLKMVFKHYGKHINLEEIKKATQLNKDGVSLLGISEAAEKYGLRTTGAKTSFDQLLNKAQLPCILFWDQKHFVVLTPSSNKKRLLVADPAHGLISYTEKEFLQHWISISENDEKIGIALFLSPRPEFYDLKEDDNKSIGWGHLIKYTFEYKAQIYQLFLGLLIGSLLQLIFPFLTQGIIDTGISTHNLNFIQIILIAQFALFFSRTIVDFMRSRILLYVSTHINLSILSDFWIKLTRLPLSFFDSKQAGDIIQRINDQHRIEGFITGTALQTLFSVFSLVVFSITLAFYSTTIFLIFISSSILYILWIVLFLKYRRTIDYKNFAIASRENSATMQLVYGMQEIKLNNAEQAKRWEWEGIQASLFRLKFKSLSLNQYQQAGGFFINEGKNIFITYLVATLVLNGQLTLGVMLAIQYILGQLNSPVEQLISFTQQAQDAKISLERLCEIHEMKDEEPKESLFTNHISTNHNIVFSNFTFTYPGAGNQPVLKNLNIEFEGGKVTAIVGMSGNGKSTILKLIQKFYENYSGEMKIGETNLKYLSPHYWRSISGSVMQEGYIFSDSIEKNIILNGENTDYEKLIYACRVANILSFIESLPMGFNTRIGAEGNGISTGQKQRILIARVVYKNPSFVFFDEATNALDANNESAILNNLQDFFKNKTVVIVAHRLSTVKHADKIVVLEDGEIIEEGNHEKLISNRGKYYQLVKNQLELSN